MPGIAFAIPTKFAQEFMDTESKSAGSRCNYFGMKMVSKKNFFYFFFYLFKN